MPKREKAHDRVEGIIRELLKLQENRRCINCNSLGPQYVCATFWTFVCTSCSGVHREFTHRVKSVSMAKFSADEISALQAGGNERARQIYFKEWDPLRHSFPNGSDQNALRDFIKHVYVDRKFTGEKSKGKLAMVKAGFMGSSELNSIERSPQHRGGIGRSSSHRSRPLNFEIVDDRVRDNRFGSSRLSEGRRTTNAELRTGSMSPVSQNSRGKISPPVVRPVKDILGVNVPPLQVGESPKASDIRDNKGLAHGQYTESSSDPVSVEGNSLQLKRVNSFSLIDFSADPEPPDHATETQTQQTSISVDGGTGASSTKDEASDAPNVNSLESILFGLSTPATGSVDIMSTPTGTADAPSPAPIALSNSIGAPVTASTINMPASFSTGYPPAASSAAMAPIQPSSSSDSNLKVTDGKQLTIMQPNQQYQSPYDDSRSSAQNTTLSVGVQSQHLPVEANSSGRKELPAGLFTYAPFPAPVPRWQIRPPHGMGSGMWYNPNAVPGATFPNPSRSTNPFDLDYDSTQSQVSMFPSMSPLQAALPNSSAPTTLLHTSDARSSQQTQPQASPYACMVSQLPSYGISVAPGAYMGQQMPNDIPFSRPQGSRGEDSFASLNPIQQPSSRNPASSTSNSFPTAGNPFG